MNDYLMWFDNLIAPKTLEVNGDAVRCFIGFNRRVHVDGVSKVIGDDIEIEASSIAEALRDAKIQYDFLTTDVASA